MKDSLNRNSKKKKSFPAFLPHIFFWIIIPLLLAILLIAVILAKIFLEKDMPSALVNTPVSLSIENYPFFAKSVLEASLFPALSAEAVVIIEDRSKVVLFSKNPDKKLPMASTTKIMTALVGLDNYSLTDMITIKTEKVEGAKAHFKEGETFLFEDVLYGLLLPSGNDAALAISQNYPGGEDNFIARMNDKAKELYLLNTNYADPTGLSEKNFTSVVDLARLASHAIKNPVFANIVGTKEKTITSVNRENTYAVHSLNKLLGTEGVTGIKTGFTDEAGEVLVTSIEKDGYRLIIVVMKSEDRFDDTKKILSFTKENIRFIAPDQVP